jgi:hypothetical protein
MLGMLDGSVDAAMLGWTVAPFVSCTRPRLARMLWVSLGIGLRSSTSASGSETRTDGLVAHLGLSGKTWRRSHPHRCRWLLGLGLLTAPLCSPQARLRVPSAVIVGKNRDTRTGTEQPTGTSAASSQPVSGPSAAVRSGLARDSSVFGGAGAITRQGHPAGTGNGQRHSGGVWHPRRSAYKRRKS